MSSEWGNYLHISIYGESHGEGIGVTLDGLPAGVAIDPDALAAFMARRAPGRDKTSTPRKESDTPEVLSGLLNGRTTGAPLSALIRNSDTHSKDYAPYAQVARPGHSDYTGFLRYGGYNDVRGGGHFSGRLTAPLCFAGAIAKQVLDSRGIAVGAHLLSVGGSPVRDSAFDPVSLTREALLAPGQKGFPVQNPDAEAPMRAAIEAARMDQDSVGGVVECAALGFPAGIGSPIFGGVENRIASLVFGIPAVKGVEFGAGFGAADLRGSQNNDRFLIDGGAVRTDSNHAGGILGGISTGMPILVRAAFKPTPSISRLQQTVNFVALEHCETAITGRHDPCVAVRAVPVMEAAVAVALLDCAMEAYGYLGWE